MASKKESNGRPQISNVSPEAAIPGGELQIRGAGLARAERPRVTIGDVDAPIVSGSGGQKTPVSVYKIDLNYTPKPFASDIMNATGLAFDKEGTLYISSRYDGTVYQVTSAGSMSVFVEGMGVATGMAFDADE